MCHGHIDSHSDNTWHAPIEQATTQVGNEMLQKEIMKAYEHKIRMEMEQKLLQVSCDYLPFP